MQFQVPQFIEVEDKIFGPLTFKQFVYMAGAAGASYLIWRSLPIYIAPVPILAVCGFAVAIAFGQYNGRPFIAALENGFYYLMHGKLYVWSNQRKPAQKREVTAEKAVDTLASFNSGVTGSKLHELAWSLDIRERIAGGTATEDDRMRTKISNIGLMHTARDDMNAMKS